MNSSEKSIETPVTIVTGSKFKQVTDKIVREVPVTLFLNNEEIATLVCSPANLKELAVGFLCSENILTRRSGLLNITINEADGLIWVEIAGEPPAAGKFLKRYITTCCGRGRASFYFINDTGIKRVTSNIRLSAGKVMYLSAELENISSLFRETGGVHGAALGSTSEILLFYEDVGRHNAVDKIFGRCFLDGTTLKDKVLVFSGRISSEILIKVAKMGIPVIISRSAPTDLAVNLGNDLGITIIGFARENRMNIYTHSQRVFSNEKS